MEPVAEALHHKVEMLQTLPSRKPMMWGISQPEAYVSVAFWLINSGKAIKATTAVTEQANP